MRVDRFPARPRRSTTAMFSARGLWAMAWLSAAACASELDGASAGELADRCHGCHPVQAEAHARSRHSVAAKSAVFVALAARAKTELGEVAGQLCFDCHRPEAGTAEGLSCLTCHAARGNRGTKNGLLVIDLDGPIRGPLSEVDSRAPHAVIESPFSMSSDLCGTCHDVDGPAGFKETPFAHWLESPAAAADVQCRHCHMGGAPGDPEAPRPEGTIAELPDAPLRVRSNHAMAGVGSFLDDGAELARALLAAGVELSVSSVVRDGDGVRIEARVAHGGAGHHVPDGASFLRALWVAPCVTDGAGTRRCSDENVHWLSARLLRGGAEVALPTEADTVEFRGLRPGDARMVTFEGVEASPEDRVEVCLRFRRYRPEVVTALGVDAAEAGAVVEVECAAAP